HARFVCENCGYRFDVNYSPDRPSATDINIPRRWTTVNQKRVYCPNCNFAVPDQQSERPLVFYGDRILVLKYSYLLREPRRWDVVVFKPPASPEIHHYNQAYIKRLIGTPGEQVMIVDGDIYVATVDNPT